MEAEMLLSLADIVQLSLKLYEIKSFAFCVFDFVVVTFDLFSVFLSLSRLIKNVFSYFFEAKPMLCYPILFYFWWGQSRCDIYVNVTCRPGEREREEICKDDLFIPKRKNSDLLFNV
eukprot:gene11309-7841_t